jgi:hypothetical protein
MDKIIGDCKSFSSAIAVCKENERETLILTFLRDHSISSIIETINNLAAFSSTSQRDDFLTLINVFKKILNVESVFMEALKDSRFLGILQTCLKSGNSFLIAILINIFLHFFKSDRFDSLNVQSNVFEILPGSGIYSLICNQVFLIDSSEVTDDSMPSGNHELAISFILAASIKAANDESSLTQMLKMYHDEYLLVSNDKSHSYSDRCTINMRFYSSVIRFSTSSEYVFNVCLNLNLISPVIAPFNTELNKSVDVLFILSYLDLISSFPSSPWTSNYCVKIDIWSKYLPLINYVALHPQAIYSNSMFYFEHEHEIHVASSALVKCCEMYSNIVTHSVQPPQSFTEKHLPALMELFQKVYSVEITELEDQPSDLGNMSEEVDVAEELKEAVDASFVFLVQHNAQLLDFFLSKPVFHCFLRRISAYDNDISTKSIASISQILEHVPASQAETTIIRFYDLIGQVATRNVLTTSQLVTRILSSSPHVSKAAMIYRFLSAVVRSPVRSHQWGLVQIFKSELGEFVFSERAFSLASSTSELEVKQWRFDFIDAVYKNPSKETILPAVWCEKLTGLYTNGPYGGRSNGKTPAIQPKVKVATMGTS